jgi:hypothetical protein
MLEGPKKTDFLQNESTDKHTNVRSLSLYQPLPHIFTHTRVVFCTPDSVFTRSYFGLFEMCHTIFWSFITSFEGYVRSERATISLWPRTVNVNATGRIKSLKNSSDSIGNQTRDLPVWSAVPQPTAPPRTRHTPVQSQIISFVLR